MICEKCKRSFERPLELYNGDWACPLCHESLTLSNIRLVVTDETEELFKMSEVCYLRALKTPPADKKAYSDLLTKAVDFCKEAAHRGHPKALLRLAYLYDAGYFSIDGSEAFRLAYDYYKAVWKGKINDMRGSKANADYSEGGVKVRKSAARLYLNLLKNAPPKMRSLDRYRYDSELRAVKDAGLYESGGDSASYGVIAGDRAGRICEILDSCFSKERAPLFGLMMVSSEEFSALAKMTETGRTGVRNKLLRIAEKVDLYLVDVTSGIPRAVRNTGDLAVADGNYCLYFFNTQGRHALSGGKMNAVRKSLQRGDSVTDFARVNELISIISRGEEYCDYVFGDDDITVHKSKTESVGHALGDLIKTVQKNVLRGEA